SLFSAALDACFGADAELPVAPDCLDPVEAGDAADAVSAAFTFALPPEEPEPPPLAPPEPDAPLPPPPEPPPLAEPPPPEEPGAPPAAEPPAPPFAAASPPP